MLHVCVVLVYAVACAAMGAASPSPLFLIGVDGVSSRGALRSSGYQKIMNMSAYTLRCRTVEHTKSRQAWPAIIAGGYDKYTPLGPRHPPLFTYFKTLMPSMSMWHLSSYEWVRKAVGYLDADYYMWANPSLSVTDKFINAVDDLRGGEPPELAVLYFMDPDTAGHDFGWDSYSYNMAVNDTAAQILRLHERFPNARMIITSDHGGFGGGHSYFGRNMKKEFSDIDSPIFRDVPWISFPDANPRPLCDTIRNDETAWVIATHFGLESHPSWRRRVGWFAANATPTCTREDVMPVTVLSEAPKEVVACFLFVGIAVMLM